MVEPTQEQLLKARELLREFGHDESAWTDEEVAERIRAINAAVIQMAKALSPIFGNIGRSMAEGFRRLAKVAEVIEDGEPGLVSRQRAIARSRTNPMHSR
jgi:uncharacterized heparinase superfamily protein